MHAFQHATPATTGHCLDLSNSKGFLPKTSSVVSNIFHENYLIPVSIANIFDMFILVRPLAARAKGPGFEYPIAQHVQILISRAFK